MRWVLAFGIATALMSGGLAGGEERGHGHDGHQHHGHHGHGHDHHHHGSLSHFGFSWSPYRHYSSSTSLSGYIAPGSYWWSGTYRPYSGVNFLYNRYEPPYGIYYNPQADYVDYYLPPLYVPPELLGFGPQAFNQFMGYDRSLQLRNLRQQQLWQQQVLLRQQALRNAANNVNQVVPQAQQPAAAEAAPAARQSDEAARQRSRGFIRQGDTLFAQQRYHEAIQRYRSAQAAAPDTAEPFFREAHARTATGRYDLALENFRRALEQSPDLTRDGFTLDNLYGSSQLAKRSHLESLAQKALEEPDSADVLFLLGLFLYYDSQAERAETFFTRAAALRGGDPHLQRFLADAAPAGAEGPASQEGISL